MSFPSPSHQEPTLWESTPKWQLAPHRQHALTVGRANQGHLERRRKARAGCKGAGACCRCGHFIRRQGCFTAKSFVEVIHQTAMYVIAEKQRVEAQEVHQAGTIVALLGRLLRRMLKYSIPEMLDEWINRWVLLSIPSSVVVRDGYI